MKKSCIHIYCGDGKGKSTAVMGLALRAAGSGKKVVLTQFLKDGKSSELNILKGLPQVTVLTCQKQFGFFWNMTEEQKTEARAAYQELFDKAVQTAEEEDAFLLVMDEFMAEMCIRDRCNVCMAELWCETGYYDCCKSTWLWCAGGCISYDSEGGR